MHENTELPQPSNTTTFPENQTWIVCEGEKVRVCSDESVAIVLQDDIVGWHDDMRHVNNTFYSPLFTAVPAHTDVFGQSALLSTFNAVSVMVYISNFNKVQS